jgi:hypothetical protein
VSESAFVAGVLEDIRGAMARIADGRARLSDALVALEHDRRIELIHQARHELASALQMLQLALDEGAVVLK